MLIRGLVGWRHPAVSLPRIPKEPEPESGSSEWYRPGLGVRLRTGSGCRLAPAAAGGMMVVVVGLLVTGWRAIPARLYHG
jgi:hypothetical protein